MKTRKPSPATSRYQALIQILRTADTLWNASRVFFTKWDLSPSQFNVLNLLSDEPDGLSQIELGRQLLMHRSNVTGLVDRLEKRGLICRKEVEGDRRAYRVVLTAPARKLMSEILPEFHSLANAIWENIPGTHIRDLTADLSRLTANAEKLANVKEEP